MKKIKDLIPCISIIGLLIYLIRDHFEEKDISLVEG